MPDQVSGNNVAQIMAQMGQNAQQAATWLANCPTQTKNNALKAAAQSLRKRSKEILAANQKDMVAARQNGIASAFLDRLELNEARIEAMAQGVEAIVELDDPVGSVIAEWDRPNGLHIERVRTPLGVVGVIFESRPNVTADVGALCLKSGNAVILRGGSDSYHSSCIIHACIEEGLVKTGMPAHAVQIVPTIDRAAVGEMLKGLGGSVDVIVPRGGRNLVERVQNEARVPVFSHLEGLCHVYVDGSADIEMACNIVVNAKMRRTGICGAAETLLLDQAITEHDISRLVEALRQSECELRGDAGIVALHPALLKADEDDWSTEYLDAILSVKRVDGVDGAIEHIRKYSSSHTESVIAEDEAVAERFFKEIDSAILLHNASTQFADGGEFGMGAEIGIATGKMHARGPIGIEQLTSFKYIVRGSGQIRP